MEENGTLLQRILHRAARAARSVAHLRPSSPPSSRTPATPCRRPPSLLDCTDDVDAGSLSFHTAASSTPAETPSRSRQLGLSSPSPGGAVDADVDRRAEEFIERFRRNASLELRYCSPSSPVTPAMPPTSPDTYFNLSRLHGAARDHGAPVRARPAYGRSSPGARASGTSIRWPSSTYLRRRPTVQV